MKIKIWMEWNHFKIIFPTLKTHLNMANYMANYSYTLIVQKLAQLECYIYKYNHYSD